MQRLLATLAFLIVGCPKPQPPPQPDLIAQKCSARAPDDRPIIVAWQNTDKALLETQRTHGLIAVRYLGCEMKVLTQCGLPAKYEYTPVTTKHDHVNIESADELVAKLPVGALSVAGKLQQSGKLSVDMLVVGRFEAARKVYRKEDLEGDCNEATHLVSGITVGAFDFASGAEANVGGGVSAPVGEVGSTHHEKKETVSQDGSADACKKSGPDDKAPPFNCGGMLRLELIELKASAARCAPGLDWDGQGCVAKTCDKGMHFETGKGCVADAAALDTK